MCVILDTRGNMIASHIKANLARHYQTADALRVMSRSVRLASCGIESGYRIVAWLETSPEVLAC